MKRLASHSAPSAFLRAMPVCTSAALSNAAASALILASSESSSLATSAAFCAHWISTIGPSHAFTPVLSPSMPGARCSANATQRDYFERRCDKVFQADRKEAAEHAAQREWDLDCETTLAVEADVETLSAMF